MDVECEPVPKCIAEKRSVEDIWFGFARHYPVFGFLPPNDPSPSLCLVKYSVSNSSVKVLCVLFFERQAVGQKFNERFACAEGGVCTLFGPGAFLGRGPGWGAGAKELHSIDQETTKRHNCEASGETFLRQGTIWIRLVWDRDMVPSSYIF